MIDPRQSQPSWLRRAAFVLVGLPFFALPLPLAAAPDAVPNQAPEVDEWLYQVRLGDSLWIVAREQLTSIRFVAGLQQLNRITDPFRLQPGSTLRIPVAWSRWRPVAQLRAARGDVRIDRAGASIAVVAGTTLNDGDVIHTGTAANASLSFDRYGEVLVSPATDLLIERAREYGRSDVVDVRLRLLRGSAENVVARVRERQARFRIETPAAVTAVRGTRYRTGTLSDAGTTRVEVLEGRVDAASSAGSVGLDPGFGTVVASGEAPKVTPLLAPLALTGLPAVVTSPAARFTLPSAERVAGWRAQIFAAEEQVPVLDKLASTVDLPITDLPDGSYLLRVRGVDAAGLEGIGSEHRFTVDLRPAPPFPIEPAPQAELDTARPAFRWTEYPEATGYRFQLGTDPELAAPLVDRTTSGALVEPPALAPGRYYWRVATMIAKGPGDFSATQLFTLRPDAPSMAPPGAESGEMVFRWRADAQADRYRFQIARDPDFADTVVDEIVAADQYRLARPAPGKYFVRVRSERADGIVGPFAGTQRFEIEKKGSWWLLLIPAALILLLP